MPDKSQNININYRVNTADVTKAEQTLRQAQATSDRFSQSAQQSGRAAQQSYTQATSSILLMKQELERLKFRIENTSTADVKRLQALSSQYKNLDAQIKILNKDLLQQDKIIKESAQSTKGLASQFGSLYTSIKLILAAGLTREIISTTLEMAKLSGNVEGVERAFFRAFPQGKLLLGDLQRATHGAVSEFELMQRTLQATNLGVAVESLPVLFEFAAARAQQTGESVDYLVDSIVRGIGRKSILVLDNLGLSATRLREQFNGASLASQSVADVTVGVAEIARQELQKMGGYVETAATKVDQLTVSWTELKTEISDLATQEGGFIDALKDFVDSFELLIEARNKEVSVMELSNQRRREESAQFSVNLFQQTALTKSKEDNIKVINNEIQRLTKSIGSWAAFRDEMDAQIVSLEKQKVGRLEVDYEIAKEIDLTKKLRDAKREDALIDQEIIKLLMGRLSAMKEIAKETEKLGLIAAKEEQIKAVTEAISDAKTTQGIHNLNNELAKLNGELADLKAFGTTKQMIEVNGKLKLVPVVDPKDIQKTLEAEPLFKKGVTIPFTFGNMVVGNQAPSTREATDQLQARIDQLIADMPKNISKPLPVTKILKLDGWDQFTQEFEDNWQEVLDRGFDSSLDLFDSVLQAENDMYAARISNSNAFYDEQIKLAGDNERKKLELSIKRDREEKKLRMAAFEVEKENQRAMTIVNGATAIIKAFATASNFYEGLAQAAIIAAETAIQVAVINNSKPRFAKGVIDLKGPGTGTSDSINARLSRGESVMTAEETRNSMGVLKAVRARKLDDKVLENLKLSSTGVSYQAMDDSRIVSELKELKRSQVDYMEKAGVLWKTKRKGEKYKQWVRARSI